MKIAEQVKKVFTYLAENDLLTQEMIDNLSDIQYSKKHLKSAARMTNYPLLKKLLPNIDERVQRLHDTAQSRYYKPSSYSLVFNGEPYLFCSQIHIEDKVHFSSWLKKNYSLEFDEVVGLKTKPFTAPDEAFFTADDFALLEKWGGKKYDSSSPEHQAVFKELRSVYDKVKKWVQLICDEQGIESGEWEVIRNPTNQKQEFDDYQWARIFPGWEKRQTRVAISPVVHKSKFIIKIDQLNNISSKRKEIYDGLYRKFGSQRLYQEIEISKVTGWEELLLESNKLIEDLLPVFEEIAMKVNLLGIAAKLTWNSNRWKDHPTDSDLQHSSGYAHVEEYQIAMESINFACDRFPADAQGYYSAYSPNLNKLPKDKDIDYIFLISKDFDNQDKIVGFFKDPVIKNHDREPLNEYYSKYNNVNFKSKVSDIVELTEFLPFDEELFLSDKQLAKQRFTYLDGENVASVLNALSGIAPGMEAAKEAQEEIVAMPSILNKIYYGPPGTGKTYEVRREALRIIKGDVPSDYSQVIKEFDELKQNGQIDFVTFHPNFGYESFVEGIFPDVDGKSLSYSIKDGVFKRICSAAKDNLKNVLGTNLDADEEFEVRWGLFLEEIVDHGSPIPFRSLDDNVPYDVDATKTDGISTKRANGNGHNIAKKRFKRVFKDLVARGNRNPTRSEIMETSLKTYIAPIMRKLFSYKVDIERSRVSEGHKKFVLIIDEINRGNIPSIFGELITLIEASKRIGNKEELHLTLPLSDEEFGVPNNLYIIGTMNTADRSVEALDSALRRRFSFIPKYPIHGHEAIENAGDVDICRMLEVMNLRIKALKGEDYQIGHSYFMHIKDEVMLARVFGNKILPLLSEYFYDDLKKVQMVLGSTFVRPLGNAGVKFLGDEEFDELERYEMASSDIWDFKKIYE